MIRVRLLAPAMMALVSVAVVAQDRPSWRTETPTRPELAEVPTDIERPAMQFEVDRSALLLGGSTAASAEPAAPQARVVVTQPELGRAATLLERMETAFTAPEPVPEAAGDTGASSPAEPAAPAPVVAQSVTPAAEDISAADQGELLASLPAPAEPAPVAPAIDPRRRLSAVKTVEPDYPREALLDRTEGWVDLDVLVAPDGSVEDVQVADASPRRVFERAAVRAVNQWQFEALGAALSTRLRIEFSLGN